MAKTLFILLVITCSISSCANKTEKALQKTNDSIRAIINSPNISQLLMDTSSFPCDKPRKQVATGRTKYFIIKNAFFNNIEIKKTNAAILITDKKEIEENESLFFNNPQPVAHGCGFDYDIQFWEQPYSCLEDISYNIRCEKYCFDNDIIRNKMLEYARQLVQNPTHYIYSLKIRDKYTPVIILNTIKDREILIFFMDERLKHNYNDNLDSKYYTIQLLDESDDINEVKTRLKKYSFVEEVTEYIPYKAVSPQNKTDIPIRDTQKIYIITEQMPEFPAGKEAMEKYIKDSFRNTGSNKINGRIVVRFIVLATGDIKDIVILRGISSEYDKEIVRLIKSMPRWKPGKQDGENVPVYFTLRIVFENGQIK